MVSTIGEAQSLARGQLGQALLEDLDEFWGRVILDVVNTADVPGLATSIRTAEAESKGIVRRLLELLFVENRSPTRDEIVQIFAPNIEERLRAGVPAVGY